ncbi:MAG: leucine-rich repeat domain-containing protein, partial [Lachnospiraceae bacterium]|nr:leucine-rich repeat domain-containing protein [Lachnospiraceae bacterium]
ADIGNTVKYYISNGTEMNYENTVRIYNACQPVWEMLRYDRLKFNGTNLVEGTDYEVIDPEKNTFLNVPAEGYSSYDIVGKGNFTGVKTVRLGVKPIDITKTNSFYSSDNTNVWWLGATIDPVADQAYSPAGNTPLLSLSNRTRGTLTRGVDYTVEYSGNTCVTDNAIATVTGIGNYIGSKSVSFRIVAADIANAQLLNVSDQDYNFGEAVTLPDLAVTYDGYTLTEGVDYTVSYADNTDENSTATVTVTGIGNFTGTNSEQFGISADTRIVIAEEDVSILPESLVYDGTEKTVSANVVHDGQKLVLNTDYTCGVTYSNGSVKAGTVEVRINGKGNYKGQVVKTLEISKRNIDDLSVTGMVDYTYDGSSHTQAGLVFKLGDITLPDNEFTVEYSDNVSAGSADISITGENFDGTKHVSFNINAADISEGIIAISGNSYVYNGSQIKPDVAVSVDGFGTLTGTRDYTVTYTGNVNAGTAYVTVSGNGNFKGTLTKDFNIIRKKIEESFVSLSETTFTYTGDEQIPVITVKDGSRILEKDADYTVTVSGNTVNAGTVSAIIEGITNYSGTVVRIWTIERVAISSNVTFRVVNGLWNDGTSADKTVTLSGYEGDILKLSENQIPDVGSRPDVTYKAGSWDAVPDTETAINGDTTYTYAYAKKDSISATVTFKVVNGSWGDGSATDKTVTLTGYEGDTLKLSEDQIPAVSSKPDNICMAGWDNEPRVDSVVSGNIVYTYSFVDHDYHEVAGSAKEPTSTENGKKSDKKCSKCGDLIEGDIIEKSVKTDDNTGGSSSSGGSGSSGSSSGGSGSSGSSSGGTAGSSGSSGGSGSSSGGSGGSGGSSGGSGSAGGSANTQKGSDESAEKTTSVSTVSGNTVSGNAKGEDETAGSKTGADESGTEKTGSSSEFIVETGKEGAEDEYTYVVDGKNATLNDAEITSGKAVIPDTVTNDEQERDVTRIAAKAFKDNENLKKLVIGNKVKVIGASAFADCDNLKNVKIGSGIEKICANTFDGSQQLKKIVIDVSSLKKVGKKAFRGISEKAVIRLRGTKKQKNKARKLIEKSGVAKTVRIVG